MWKMTLAQLNPTIGDFEGNLALMLAAARVAAAQEARVVVFPELSLTAYYPGDLLDDEDFRRRLDQASAALLAQTRQTPGLCWVVGLPTRNDGPGKDYHNSLQVLRDGQVLLNYHKQLLPTYNVFDERRHFEPGPDVARVLDIAGVRVGFLICEDGWNDEGEDYLVNPFQRLADAAPDLVVSVNASPSHVGKREQRQAIFHWAAERHGLRVVYVNQVGGHDQLVYDGASFIVDPRSGVVLELPSFEPATATVVFDRDAGTFSAWSGATVDADRPTLSRAEFYRRQIVLGLKDYARRCGFTRAVVGSSGGIDSALTLALAVEALGAANVTAITMPSVYSSRGSVTDSELLCRNLGIRLLNHPIRSLVDTYRTGYRSSTGQELQGLPLENLQARIRGTILMEYSNSTGALLLTTGNKSEISVGYCTLYGDTNGGLGLIGDLYKTEVFELCRHLNVAAGREIIPSAIIDKPPSAELAPDQKDSDALPPYDLLDACLKLLIEDDQLSPDEQHESRETIARLCDAAAAQALRHRIQGLIARSEYKRRQAPPLLRVRARAFGTGRQVPITARQY